MTLNDIKFEPLIETLTVGKISDQEYFSKKYSDFISNSRLGYINPNQDGSPDKFFTSMKPIYSDSLLLGSAVHSQYLQPELFELVSIERPTAKLGFVCDYIWDHSDGSKDIPEELLLEASSVIGYYKNALTVKRINDIHSAYSLYIESKHNFLKKPGVEPMFLSPKLFETANNCIDACNKNKNFQELINPSYIETKPISENEQAFLINIKCIFPNKEPIIVKLKAKLDNFTIDFDSNTITVNDLKTIGAILPKFGGKEGNFERFHYSREIAEYMWLLRLYAEHVHGMKNPTMRANCLVVSTIPEYYTKVYKVTNTEVNRGFKEFKYLLRLVAYYMAYKNYEFT